MAGATLPKPATNNAADGGPRMILRMVIMFPSRKFVFGERKATRGRHKNVQARTRKTTGHFVDL